ncbi:MAG: hypothetical protein AB1791_17875 [Chloroflexota bacterium]
MTTLGPDIFLLLAQALRAGQSTMLRRSLTDKEFFVQEMYRFPNPLTEPDFRYRITFVTQDPGLDQNYGGLRLVARRSKTEIRTGIGQPFYVYEVP